MYKHEFGFKLPEDLIAQTPIQTRDDSRLMIVNTENEMFEHKRFKDITNYFNFGDCLVLNDTKVIPARLIGQKQNTSVKIELLLLSRLESDLWEVLVKPGKRLRVGDVVCFGGKLSAELIEVKANGNRVVAFHYSGIFEQVLDELGEMPLPHYIKTVLDDKTRYQTVYAKHDGSCAAPTAGLHFTTELLNALADKVHIARLTLHVGLGTFRPVKVDDITNHEMHSEFYILNADNARVINKAKLDGGKIIAVGTTSCRTLETCSDSNGIVHEQSGWTDIFIYPGYRFKIVDELITNFHLPESTLIMLVAALCGKEKVLRAYEEAIRLRYRFYSFGDAMLIRKGDSVV